MYVCNHIEKINESKSSKGCDAVVWRYTMAHAGLGRCCFWWGSDDAAHDDEKNIYNPMHLYIILDGCYKIPFIVIWNIVSTVNGKRVCLEIESTFIIRITIYIHRRGKIIFSNDKWRKDDVMASQLNQDEVISQAYYLINNMSLSRWRLALLLCIHIPTSLYIHTLIQRPKYQIAAATRERLNKLTLNKICHFLWNKFCDGILSYFKCI